MDGYTRKQFIEDAVKIYIKKNTKEYLEFQKVIAFRRNNLVSKHGEFKKIVGGKIKADEDTFRLAISLPSKLHNALNTILSSDDDGDFPKDKNEMYWFMKNFKEFTIPTEV